MKTYHVPKGDDDVIHIISARTMFLAVCGIIAAGIGIALLQAGV